MRTVRAREARSVPAALATAALLLAGCGTAVDGAGTAPSSPSATTASASGPSPSKRPGALPATLDEARAAWKASAATDYQLRVQRICFCPQLTVTSTVTGGRVTASEIERKTGRAASGSAGAAKDHPQTVEDLFALVARYDPQRVGVTYSPQGVPLSVVADPQPRAVDDEVTYSVVFQATAGGTRADDAGTWRRTELPAGLAWPGDPSDGGAAGARAVATRRGSTVLVYLGLWGSSSCPAVPRTLRADGVVEQPKGRVTTFAVDVDATVPPDRMCTEDYGPTVYVASLPASAVGAGKLPDLQLVASVATDAPDRAGVRAFVVPVVHD